MTTRPIDLLHSRMAEFDTDQPRFPDDEHRHLKHFVWVMAQYTDAKMGPQGRAILNPSEADRVIESSRLISKISAEQPTLAFGPESRADQHWVPTNRDPTVVRDARIPAISRFVDPSVAPNPRASAHHLRGGGLYTSTPSRGGKGMWELYLEIFPSRLTPKPWYVWSLQANTESVVEIACAADWVAFVEAYPRKVGGLVYPDWSRLSNEFVGVHITARAIAAAQGFSFETRNGLTGPGFWDVEQTIWFRWAFTASRLLRTHE